jgi:inorganic pyrophosphatase/exopolyphosphatase
MRRREVKHAVNNPGPFIGTIRPPSALAALGAVLRLSSVPAMASSAPPLKAYLADSLRALQQPSPVRVLAVLGNEAGDADSCVCAIGMARLLAHVAPPEDTRVIVPVLSVPRADFALQLDRLHLLRRAGLRGSGEGVCWRPSDVAFVDDVDLAGLHAQGRLDLCLVDHNRLSDPLAGLAACVRLMVDHHVDECQHPSVSGDARRVEVGIGSCASLVTEQLAARAPALLADGMLCSLLLGAVLLDTANLTPAAKAQKPREVDIANTLLAVAAPHLGLEPTAAGRDAYFEELQIAKTDLDALLAFPILDLLRQDYKAETLVGSSLACGVSSVVVPGDRLLAAKPDLPVAIAHFAQERKLNLCLLMCLDTSTRRRHLLAHSAQPALLGRLVEHLQREGLALAELPRAGESPAVLCFEQGNAKVGRKLLMPMLRSFAG